MKKYNKESMSGIKLCKKMGKLYVAGYSYRKIADLLGCSAPTVKEKIDKLEYLDKDLFNQICDIKEEKNKTLEKKEVRTRILKAFDYLVNYNYTVMQIAEKLNETEFTIYRDLTTRLPRYNKFAKAGEPIFDDKASNLVAEILIKHSQQNLTQNSKSK